MFNSYETLVMSLTFSLCLNFSEYKNKIRLFHVSIKQIPNILFYFSLSVIPRFMAAHSHLLRNQGHCHPIRILELVSECIRD